MFYKLFSNIAEGNSQDCLIKMPRNKNFFSAHTHNRLFTIIFLSHIPFSLFIAPTPVKKKEVYKKERGLHYTPNLLSPFPIFTAKPRARENLSLSFFPASRTQTILQRPATSLSPSLPILRKKEHMRIGTQNISTPIDPHHVSRLT